VQVIPVFHVGEVHGNGDVMVMWCLSGIVLL